MTTVTVEQFQQIELRVGTIAEAAPHPRADRLLVLRVKLNGEERQLVAGICAHYEPADLVGKQNVVVTNLAPATLRGVESQGMLLAATDPAGALALISPDRAIAAGSPVR